MTHRALEELLSSDAFNFMRLKGRLIRKAMGQPYETRAPLQPDVSVSVSAVHTCQVCHLPRPSPPDQRLLSVRACPMDRDLRAVRADPRYRAGRFAPGVRRRRRGPPCRGCLARRSLRRGRETPAVPARPPFPADQAVHVVPSGRHEKSL